jgi:CheY-like chemotaxis protein
MLFKEWNILLVDDEPDVLSVSKLALRDTTVYGLPIKIHTAHSKAEAIELLNGPLAIQGIAEGSLAVAFIDVVMESDYAGLELCEYIRETLKNRVAQLFIRTGQPGLAPERTVIDRYDISGYFTKVETTESKLYSFVKSGIRQWYSFYYSKLISDQTNLLIANSGSRQQMLDLLSGSGEGYENDGNVTGIIFEDTVVSFEPTEKVYALRDELLQCPPLIVTPEGHSLTVDGKRLLVRVVETASTVDYYYAAESFMEMPEALLDITFTNGIIFSTLWKRAKQLEQLA